MNFKFKTIRRTRNALNAQQIYWEIIKLKKYFRVKTIFGEEKKAEIIIHRTQLPNKYRTHDMSLFIEQHQETQNMFYYIAIGLFSFSFMHFYAKMLYDDDTRYWVSIRYPNHMKQFDIFNAQIQNQYDNVLEKLQLKNKDLSGAVGYHNLKQGIKDLFKRETKIIDFETTDKSIEGLDSFLQEIPALQLISVIINYLVGDTRQSCSVDKKEDIYKTILIIKNHLKNDPTLKMSLYNADQTVNKNDLTLKDIDIHYKCKFELNEVKEKIKNRDQKLADTTCSYLRDLQGLREQLYRQANIQNYDYSDHRHFDSFEVTDPKYRELLNTKLNNVKVDYEQKIKYLTQIAESQKKEIGTLKTQIQDYQFRAEHYENPEFLVRKLFHIERDPYELWRLIQDNQGNPFFFQVFSIQKKGYGIDYIEIDQLLMAVKVQDRIFERQKQTLDQQLAQFMERILEDVYDLRQKLLDKESELDTLQKKYTRNLTILNKIILKAFNKIISSYNQLLMKTSFKLWKEKELKLAPLLKDLSQFQIKHLEHDLFDFFIEQIHEMQDKVTFLELKLNGQKFLSKTLESKNSIISNTLTILKCHFNIKNYDLDLEQKLLKLDNFQIRFCQELLDQLVRQKMTYQKYLQSIQKHDKYVQTDCKEIIDQSLQTKEIMVDNVCLITYIKEKYQEKKDKLLYQSGIHNSNRSNSIQENHKSNFDQLPSLKQNNRRMIQIDSNNLKQSTHINDLQQDYSNNITRKTSLRESEITDKRQTKHKTDLLSHSPNNYQTQRVNATSLSIENDVLQMKPIIQNQEDLQLDNLDSNLLLPNQKNLLPQLQVQKEIKQNIIKQIKQIQNSQCIQCESEPEKQKKSKEGRNKSKNHKFKNNIIIQYEDYPKHEQQEQLYLFLNQSSCQSKKNKTKLTQFIYKV
ncbi:unnamed protein product [Paramecium octaurelia]|uniref:Transmembrane protein n=1 Tax=Paramecium octaurelia TaxID=43137 RepID=A0A8S1SFK2_PAROT|nr:unnamed protein product [Paramecium octaurelia]